MPSHRERRIVCFGPHVDDASADAARAAGADVVLPRVSKFFRDVSAAVAAAHIAGRQIVGQG